MKATSGVATVCCFVGGSSHRLPTERLPAANSCWTRSRIGGAQGLPATAIACSVGRPKLGWSASPAGLRALRKATTRRSPRRRCFYAFALLRHNRNYTGYVSLPVTEPCGWSPSQSAAGFRTFQQQRFGHKANSTTPPRDERPARPRKLGRRAGQLDSAAHRRP